MSNVLPERLTYDNLGGLGKQARPAVPASTVGLANPFGFACLVRISGGTVSNVTVAGATQAAASPALVYVDKGETITLTYTVAPVWDWFGVPWQ